MSKKQEQRFNNFMQVSGLTLAEILAIIFGYSVQPHEYKSVTIFA